MAKKEVSAMGANSFFKMMKGIDNTVEILSQSKSARISDYIDTGNYMLNAAMTASLFKGAPCGRVTVLAGEPATGKSFLAWSICRNAQKKGYNVLYLDSEGAQDYEGVKKLGLDMDRVIIKPVMTIRDVSTLLANLCKAMKETPEEEREKVIIVLDSLGNLTSDKEYNDILDGNNKADMTKAKEIKALFRTNAVPIAELGIPFIVCAHIYYTQDFMPKAVVGGGSGINFNASVTMMLTTAKLEDKANEEASKNHIGDIAKKGVLVSAMPKKSRFAIPQKVKFQIPFFKAPNPYVGLEEYIDWENCGIMSGKIITEKEYAKLSDDEKAKCYPMEGEKGEPVYAMYKESARTIVVKHLHKAIEPINLRTPEVFTDEILHKLDEIKIKPNFELPDQDSNADLEELIAEE